MKRLDDGSGPFVEARTGPRGPRMAAGRRDYLLAWTFGRFVNETSASMATVYAAGFAAGS